MTTRPFSFYNGAHSSECWQLHQDCALAAAISYLTARVAHDQARVRLYRQAGTPGMDAEQRDEAVRFARQLMMDNAMKDWSRAG